MNNIECIFTIFSQVEVESSLDHYRDSMMLVVHPWSMDPPEDDGVRLHMTGQQISSFTKILKDVFAYFNVPLMELWEKDLHERVAEVLTKVETKHESFYLGDSKNGCLICVRNFEGHTIYQHTVICYEKTFSMTP